MPINRSEFEKGELDPSFVVEEFLRYNADYAYDVDELIVQMASKKFAFTEEEMKDILGTLEDNDRLKSNIVRDKTYYIFRKPISSRPS